jgi:hypothetical protein
MLESLQRHVPECQLHILCLDTSTYDALSSLGIANTVLTSRNDFEGMHPQLPALGRERSKVEYYWTCGPFFMLDVFQQCADGEVLTYLDADLFFFENTTPIFDELGNASVLIVPHRYPPRLASRDCFGRFNVGWISLKKDSIGAHCLTKWCMQCAAWCFDKAEADRYGDQKYLDDWPNEFENVVILSHLGAGVAPWNISQYAITKRANRVYVNHVPLIFYHFSRLRILTPWLFDPDLQYFDCEISPSLVRMIYVPDTEQLQKQILARLPNCSRQWLCTLGAKQLLIEKDLTVRSI